MILRGEKWVENLVPRFRQKSGPWVFDPDDDLLAVFPVLGRELVVAQLVGDQLGVPLVGLRRSVLAWPSPC